MQTRPNILLINTHDSGRFFGCYGIDTVASPNIDRLAEEGVLLEQFTAASPICSPSRGAMMTGRWPQSNGLLGLTHHGFQFNEGERHAAAIYKDAGYATALFHFQHVAERQEWKNLGYEEFLCRSRDDEFPAYPDMAIPAPEVGQSVADWLGSRTDGRPFFAQVNFNETHTPFGFGGVTEDRSKGVTVPPWIERDAESERHFAMLQGAVAQLDDGVAYILEGLKASGLVENTIVVFAVDHGFEARRDKWTCYESGLGIAGILRCPGLGLSGGRRVAEPLSNVALLPTLLDLSGLSKPGNLDGHSFASALRGEAFEPEPVFSIYHNSGSRSVRCGRWKLIRNFSAEPYEAPSPVSIAGHGQAHARPSMQLFDLEPDPSELTNLAERHPVKVTELSHLLAEWMQTVGDPAWIGCI
jgi:arylsulfatase A-like enzyme